MGAHEAENEESPFSSFLSMKWKIIFIVAAASILTLTAAVGGYFGTKALETKIDANHKFAYKEKWSLGKKKSDLHFFQSMFLEYRKQIAEAILKIRSKPIPYLAESLEPIIDDKKTDEFKDLLGINHGQLIDNFMFTLRTTKVKEIAESIRVAVKRQIREEYPSVNLYANGNRLDPNETIGSIYDKYKDEEDGMLYIAFSRDQNAAK
jgi:hypothetical protein